MARWRLTQKHYLNVPGTKYVYEEVSRETGEVNRQEFVVPRLLDPADPRSCRSNGDCIVCHGDPAVRGDWPFLGDPTPDMEPLDDEAQAISDSLRDSWQHPIDSLSGQGYGTDLISAFEKQMTAIMKAMPQMTVQGPSDDLVALKAQVEQLAQQNAALLERLDKQSSGIRKA